MSNDLFIENKYSQRVIKRQVAEDIKKIAAERGINHGIVGVGHCEPEGLYSWSKPKDIQYFIIGDASISEKNRQGALALLNGAQQASNIARAKIGTPEPQELTSSALRLPDDATLKGDTVNLPGAVAVAVGERQNGGFGGCRYRGRPSFQTVACVVPVAPDGRAVPDTLRATAEDVAMDGTIVALARLEKAYPHRFIIERTFWTKLDQLAERAQ